MVELGIFSQPEKNSPLLPLTPLYSFTPLYPSIKFFIFPTSPLSLFFKVYFICIKVHVIWEFCARDYMNYVDSWLIVKLLSNSIAVKYITINRHLFSISSISVLKFFSSG
ncbi:unnamed protein product [Rhizophagus irregularis]|nr:unnamed protein product [Rhizophagus irregularis]